MLNVKEKEIYKKCALPSKITVQTTLNNISSAVNSLFLFPYCEEIIMYLATRVVAR